MSEVFVRVARWNHANAHIVDPSTGKIVAPILPIDKTANASGMRKITPTATDQTESDSGENGEIPQLLQDYSDEIHGNLPPAYLPLNER